MQIYERLDKGCRARVIAITGNEVLIDARWPTALSNPLYNDTLNCARNIVCVSKEYFERKYGVAL